MKSFMMHWLARLHRGVVHLGGCWPIADHDEPCPAVELRADRPMPALSGPLAGYVHSERAAVPDAWREAGPNENPKYAAIASYPSQTGPASPLSYLFSFVRADEIFFPEMLRRDETGALVRTLLRVDPRPDDGGVAELTVRHDGDVLGVAIDSAPLPLGDHISVETEGEARSEAKSGPNSAGEAEGNVRLPRLETVRCWPVGAAR